MPNALKGKNNPDRFSKPKDLAEQFGIDNIEWKHYLQKEVPLSNYPTYEWKLKLDEFGYLIFKDYYTISQYLLEKQSPEVCPFGNLPSPIACLEEAETPQVASNAYLISALRFELNPCDESQQESIDPLLGIPKSLKDLFQEIKSQKNRVSPDSALQASSEDVFDSALAQLQSQARYWYHRELVPHMNANSFAPELHYNEFSSNKPRQIAEGIDRSKLPFLYPYPYRTNLSREMVEDLTQYVRLQNSPYLFFDLMQWIERDVLKLRWQSLQKGIVLSNQDAAIAVMANWQDRDGYQREAHEVFPEGVPIAYIQSIRRQGQPFITQEFAGKSHGEMTHWFQEHIWRRFCYRYPDRCQMQPSEFLKELGYFHPAFADAIYESHMSNLANPANTHFWYIFQYYLSILNEDSESLDKILAVISCSD